MEKAFIDIHPFPGAHVHVIGIGGASMSGLARILRERGYTVFGSDRVENEAVQALRADGFRVAVGHRAENVRGADLVVYSSAIPEDHVERLACVREQIPCMERSELLGRISEGYGQTVCICGTVEIEEEDSGVTDSLHLWNAVILDDEWYMADVTWDDPDDEEEIRDAYVYLNITDQVMALDHTTDKTYAQITDDEYGLLECYINNYLPPTCTATDYCYYLREGIRMSSPDVDALCDGIVRAAEKRSAALMINAGSDTTAQALCDSLFDGDQPYYQAMDQANTVLADAPLNTDADAVYYSLDDRGLIVFEMPYR